MYEDGYRLAKFFGGMTLFYMVTNFIGEYLGSSDTLNTHNADFFLNSITGIAGTSLVYGLSNRLKASEHAQNTDLAQKVQDSKL